MPDRKELLKKGALSIPGVLSLALPFAGYIRPAVLPDINPQGTPDTDSWGKKPNIVFILADDLGYGDISIFDDLNDGKSAANTSHIDSIARDGIAFTDAYVAAPVCSPSRAGIMAARFPSAMGFEDNRTTRGGFARIGADTLPALLKNRGYVTGAIGKWDLGGTITVNSEGIVGGVGVADPDCLPHSRGFNYFYGFPGGKNSYYKIGADSLPAGGWHLYDGKARRGDGAGGKGTVDPALNLSRNIREYRFDAGSEAKKYTERNPDEHLTDVFTAKALDFIDASAGQDNPFFLYLAYNCPHDPYQVPDEFYQKYPYIPDDARRVYTAMVDQLDTRIGEVLAKLEEKGIAGSTIVIFASDNGGVAVKVNGVTKGPAYNGGLRGGKYDLYEGGVRVPLAIKWPSVYPGGRRFTGMVSTLDLLPTLAAVAGYGDDKITSYGFDGVNLLPYLNGTGKGDIHDAFYWRSISEFQTEKGSVKYAVRKGSLKYHYGKTPGGTVTERLFDLETNRAENDGGDLSGKREYSAALADIKAGLDAWEARMFKLPAGTPGRSITN
ncbi:MAG: sulfatase-like hydrolase/transferase [Treponema sp.]|jgi:arylsulfatase A-like enzyme|nr:sulfatase-like hydrolase/transferase [Treponema sp.]